MGRHSGERSGETSYVAPKPRRARLLGLALALTATLVAWGVLVLAAIDFGAEARSGESFAWVFLGIATLGAAVCLFTTLMLGGRMLRLVRGAPAPARLQGGRRAAR